MHPGFADSGNKSNEQDVSDIGEMIPAPSSRLFQARSAFRRVTSQPDDNLADNSGAQAAKFSSASRIAAAWTGAEVISNS